MLEKKEKKNGRKKNGDILNFQFFTIILFYITSNSMIRCKFITNFLHFDFFITQADDGEKAWSELQF